MAKHHGSLPLNEDVKKRIRRSAGAAITSLGVHSRKSAGPDGLLRRSRWRFDFLLPGVISHR